MIDKLKEADAIVDMNKLHTHVDAVLSMIDGFPDNDIPRCHIFNHMLVVNQ